MCSFLCATAYHCCFFVPHTLVQTIVVDDIYPSTMDFPVDMNIYAPDHAFPKPASRLSSPAVGTSKFEDVFIKKSGTGYGACATEAHIMD